MSAAWTANRVMVFAGQHDSRVKTGEDYDTRALGSLFAMEPDNKPKHAGLAFIPSTYHDYDGREHKAQRERGTFVALTADIDKGDHPIARIEALARAFAGDAAWLVYSSAHAKPGDMRWRAILPLDKPVAFATWHEAQHAFFTFLEAGGVAVDWALDRAAQPVYLPNVPATHAKTGEALRSSGRALHYRRATTGTDGPGLSFECGAPAAGVAGIRRARERDERERQKIKAEARRRCALRPQSEAVTLIDTFNASTSIRDLLAAYGYEASSRNADDFRSPHQTGGSYATRLFLNHWISLSASDVAAGLGRACVTGCYGDAYDLFVHFEHSGNHRSAFRQLGREARDKHPENKLERV